MTDQASRPDQEGFGEASLGEAQSSNPPNDPEMIRDESEQSGTSGDASSAEEDTDDAAKVEHAESEADADETDLPDPDQEGPDPDREKQTTETGEDEREPPPEA
jgi:hypothetical protein